MPEYEAVETFTMGVVRYLGHGRGGMNELRFSGLFGTEQAQADFLARIAGIAVVVPEKTSFYPRSAIVRVNFSGVEEHRRPGLVRHVAQEVLLSLRRQRPNLSSVETRQGSVKGRKPQLVRRPAFR